VIVTCLMATKNRRHLVQLALDCFANLRTDGYFEKRLVVVEDGDDNVSDMVGANIFENRHYMRHEGRQVAKIDAAIKAHPSDVYALWDDDDWHHPERVLHAALELRREDRMSVGYNVVEFYVMETGLWYVHVNPEPIDATLVFKSEYWHRRDMDLTRHNDWVRSLRDQEPRTLVLPNRGMYIAVRHGANTCTLAFKEGDRCFVPLTPPRLPDGIRNLRERL